MKIKTTLARYANFQLACVAAVLTGVAGCNSSSDDSLPISDIQVMPVTSSKLTSATESQMTLTLQNGLYLSAIGQNAGCSDCQFISTDGVPEAVNSSGNFSTTTTHESGVDESDRVKYDGNILYVANNRDGDVFSSQTDDEVATAYVRVLNRNADDSLSEVSVIHANEDAGYLSDLYLHQNVLTMIYDVYQPMSTQSTTPDVASTSVVMPYSSTLGLSFQNVTAPDSPQQLAEFEIDGYLVSSRRIDNKVYIVSRYSPSLPENIEVPTDLSNAERQQLYRDILATDLNQVLPKITQSSGVSKALVTAEDCYIPAQHSSNYGFATITTVTTFDLDNPTEFASSCVLAPLDGFYASTNNMYLYEKQYSETDQSYQTVIHKFGFQQQGIKYLATGAVRGHVSWNNSHLRFSERDNYLRVLTSERDFSIAEANRIHRLFILKDNEQQDLVQVAELPNAENPSAIGKPDEDIYAVRYFGDKAYIVTFRTTDPLYVIDLADPNSPVIEGELEIPGYSGYLQPINENFVLGIGQQLDPNQAIGTVIVEQPNTEFIEGAKAELYDISDPTQPRVAATLVYPNRYSAAEWDYRALTQLKSSDSIYRFAFPLGGWSQTTNDEEVTEWTYHQSMQLIELNIAGQGSLANIASLEPSGGYNGQWGDRAVLHDELVYYIRGNLIWQSYWQQPDLLTGPY